MTDPLGAKTNISNNNSQSHLSSLPATPNHIELNGDNDSVVEAVREVHPDVIKQLALSPNDRKKPGETGFDVVTDELRNSLSPEGKKRFENAAKFYNKIKPALNKFKMALSISGGASHGAAALAVAKGAQNQEAFDNSAVFYSRFLSGIPIFMNGLDNIFDKKGNKVEGIASFISGFTKTQFHDVSNVPLATSLLNMVKMSFEGIEKHLGEEKYEKFMDNFLQQDIMGQTKSYLEMLNSSMKEAFIEIKSGKLSPTKDFGKFMDKFNTIFLTPSYAMLSLLGPKFSNNKQGEQLNAFGKTIRVQRAITGVAGDYGMLRSKDPMTRIFGGVWMAGTALSGVVPFLGGKSHKIFAQLCAFIDETINILWTNVKTARSTNTADSPQTNINDLVIDDDSHIDSSALTTKEKAVELTDFLKSNFFTNNPFDRN